MNPSRTYSLRFARWAGSEEDAFSFFSTLISPHIDGDLNLVLDPTIDVDIEISSVYGYLPGSTLPIKLFRLIRSKLPGGVPFGSWAKGFNFQPNPKAKVNIFYTGENERPPFGDWDAYLSFDLDDYDRRNAYLPLWWCTCTDLDGKRIAPYLGKPLKIEEMLITRQSSLENREKFCVAFIGKAYPFRLQALARLSNYKNVDIYGAIARKPAKDKFDISQKYKFVFCFENDLFPGYVTEKVMEAWATGAIPLYWGDDPSGYINPKAIINLKDFKTFEGFLNRVSEVDNNPLIWKEIASQPILTRKPDLTQVSKVLSSALRKLS
jgi:hypothetical protein